MSFHVHSLAALALIVSISVPALAQEHPVVQASVSVKYADLDLDTIAGAATLLARIRTAAHTVCSADLENRKVLDQCMRESTERALAQIDRPVPTALYAGNASMSGTRKD